MMEFKQIQELIKQINRSHLTELHIEQKDFKIIIKKDSKSDEQSATQAIPTMQVVSPAMSYPAQPVPSAVPTAASQQPQDSDAEKQKEDKENENFVTIKSPMIGTFYRGASPGKPAFVNVGDGVATGKVVCIIEAMKLFNEVESEVNGKIVKILVDDASPVEYDQPLFLVEP